MGFYSKIKAHPILDMETVPPPAINVEVAPVLPIMEEDEDAETSTETLLQIALTGEYQQWDLYTSYASRLKGLSRGGIADEFKDHAKEELDHIELLQRYLVSMGVNPTLQRKTVPELSTSATIRDIVQLQLKFEYDAVTLYKKILAILPENEPLKLDIESVIIKEQEHAHDLELMLKNPTVAKVMATFFGEIRDPKGQGYFRATEPGEPTKPQAGYGQGCGCGCGGCQCSFLTKVDHTWCTRAFQELRPDLYARWYQGQLLTPQEKAFVAQAIALKGRLKDSRFILRFLDASRA